MKNAIFYDVLTRRSCKKRCFGGTYRLHRHSVKYLLSVIQLLVTATDIYSSLNRSTLMKEEISSPKT
jgi:hypothetical protein